MTFAAASPPPPCSESCCAKDLVPERAMVPRFCISSSRDMPTPLSSIVSVLRSASVVIWMPISDGSIAPSPLSPAPVSIS